MHIADGFLGPQTWIGFYGLMIPAWYISSKQAKKNFRAGYVPALAIGSAFSFIIMMFNIPIPGGSTGHAVGTALLSILFGPWAASILITIAIAIQALLFGDGGITSFAVNSFNMAYVPAFAGYYLYKLILSKDKENPARKIFAAGIAGYLSITLASLTTGIILGLQPILNHTVNWTPLYFPYSLKVSVPAMVLEHLVIFGWVEAAVTAGVIGFLMKEKYNILSFLEEDKNAENI